MQRPTRDEQQPPLGPWSHLWRFLLCLLISAVLWSSVAEGQWRDHRFLWWTDVLIGSASYVLVMFRRRWPLTVGVVTQLMMVLSGIAAGPATLAAVSVATRLRLVPTLVVSVAMVFAGVGFYAVQPVAAATRLPLWLDVAANVVITTAIMGWGMYIGSRRQMIRSLRERAERAETEQALRARQAQAGERTRIAREMHDVLAHRISQISMQAGALSYRTDLGADTLREGTAEIQATANQALTDLRGVLGVLRDQDGAPLDRPVPTYREVAELVEQARATGMHVIFLDLVEGEAASMPDSSGRALFRIVQEGITNARKHAPGAMLTISISGAAGRGIGIRLTNPFGFGTGDDGATPGAGLGLIGLTERAALGGGRLSYRSEGASFVVEGWVPWAP